MTMQLREHKDQGLEPSWVLPEQQIDMRVVGAGRDDDGCDGKRER